MSCALHNDFTLVYWCPLQPLITDIIKNLIVITRMNLLIVSKEQTLNKETGNKRMYSQHVLIHACNNFQVFFSVGT